MARLLTRPNRTTLLLTLCAAALSARTYAEPPETKTDVKPEPFAGCVTQSSTEKSTLILSTSNLCAKLTGTAATSSLAGHTIELTGILTPGSGHTASIIQVEHVTKTGPACTDTCSLLPPRKRGLQKPGKEGGTPGLVPTEPPPKSQ